MSITMTTNVNKIGLNAEKEKKTPANLDYYNQLWDYLEYRHFAQT